MRKFLLNSLAAACMAATASTASAQNHDFAGSYLMTNFYTNYLTEDFSMDDLPLVIDEDNVIQNFASYTPFTDITGQVEGNQFTLTSSNDYIVLDINWDNFHYIVLNGETFGDEFEYAPVTITYDPESDQYEMSSWMLWDYDPISGVFEKMAYCMVFALYPGELHDDVDYTGNYIVTGTKTVYNGGNPSESQESFLMSIRPDEDGLLYEFTNFAGYEVGNVPRGWLGVYGALYKGTDLEIQGTDIRLDENGDGIKLAGPFMEFDDMYTVTVFFEDQESGIVSDFSVWKMEGGEPVELLAKWSYLTFVKDNGSDGIRSPFESPSLADEAPVYYDMQGMKVKNPTNGIYILKQGDKTRKVIIRN